MLKATVVLAFLNKQFSALYHTWNSLSSVILVQSCRIASMYQAWCCWHGLVSKVTTWDIAWLSLLFYTGTYPQLIFGAFKLSPNVFCGRTWCLTLSFPLFGVWCCMLVTTGFWVPRPSHEDTKIITIIRLLGSFHACLGYQKPSARLVYVSVALLYNPSFHVMFHLTFHVTPHYEP